MNYLPLFSLRLTHTYYTNGRSPDFQISPTAATQRLLKNQRSVLKTKPDGVQILTAVSADNAPFIPLPETAVFSFILTLQNSEFNLFTDLKEWEQMQNPLFTNQDSVNEPILALTDTEPPKQHPASFAQVEIQIPQQTELNKNGLAFQINFTAKQVRWRYYVVVENSDAELRIEDQANAPLTFSEQNRTDLNQNEPTSDEIALTLADKFPDKQRYRFLSDDLIFCQQQARKSLQLRLDGNQVAGTLPNPPLTNFALATNEQNGAPQKEDTLFQIIKYFNQESTTGGI